MNIEKNTVKILTYDIETLMPYVNWIYFNHAWGLDGKPAQAKRELKEEALAMLRRWQGRYVTRAVFALYDANSDGDDLIVNGTRVPMLRQQTGDGTDGLCYCLSDFVRPLSSGVKDTVGVFATTAGAAMVSETDDNPYDRMMAQTLADRLAEATAEVMHRDVRVNYWGYAPDEHLSIDDLHAERYQGIRPAIGYPSLPDVSANFILQTLVPMRDIGIRLTETGMMMPHASVSGFMFAHPQSRYFNVGPIGEDQLADYARRRGVDVETMRTFLRANLREK